MIHTNGSLTFLSRIDVSSVGTVMARVTSLKNHKAWRDAMHVANGVYNGHLDDLVEGATHYHAHYVNPSWADTKTYVTRIDDHIFYRWEIKDE